MYVCKYVYMNIYIYIHMNFEIYKKIPVREVKVVRIIQEQLNIYLIAKKNSFIQSY